MTNNQIIENVFKVITALAMAFGLFILRDFGDSLDAMQGSVNKLNVSFATMSERLVSQAVLSGRLQSKIDHIEEKTKFRWTKADHIEYAKEIREEIKQLRAEIDEIMDNN